MPGRMHNGNETFDPPSSLPGPDDQVINNDQNELDIVEADRVFGGLLDRQKDIFLLYYRESLTLKQVGQKVGLCPERVRHILLDCKKHIKRQLKYSRSHQTA